MKRVGLLAGLTFNIVSFQMSRDFQVIEILGIEFQTWNRNAGALRPTTTVALHCCLPRPPWNRCPLRAAVLPAGHGLINGVLTTPRQSPANEAGSTSPVGDVAGADRLSALAGGAAAAGRACSSTPTSRVWPPSELALADVTRVHYSQGALPPCPAQAVLDIDAEQPVAVHVLW